MGLRLLKTKCFGARRPFNIHNWQQISMTTLTMVN